LKADNANLRESNRRREAHIDALIAAVNKANQGYDSGFVVSEFKTSRN
jgi:hypothetical protein